MNRLALCKNLHLKLGSGDEGMPGTLPATTLNLTGRLAQMVDWVDTAWEEIQNSQKYWQWMYKVGTYSATAGSSDYTITSTITDFEMIWPFTAMDGHSYILTRASGGYDTPVHYVEYSEFIGYYTRSGISGSSGVPQYFTITPTKHLLVYPMPSVDQTITIPYRKTNQVLSEDSHIPEMPSRFHMAIVLKAMEYNGASDENNRQYQTANTQYKMLYQQLCNNQIENPKSFWA